MFCFAMEPSISKFPLLCQHTSLLPKQHCKPFILIHIPYLISLLSVNSMVFIPLNQFSYFLSQFQYLKP